MNSKDLTIGVLSTTAVILLVGLLVIQAQPESALAAGMTTTAGPYGLTVGVASINDEEVLFVTDNSKQKMVIYRFNNSSAKMEVIQGIDLAELRKSGGGAATGTNPRRGRP